MNFITQHLPKRKKMYSQEISSEGNFQIKKYSGGPYTQGKCERAWGSGQKTAISERAGIEQTSNGETEMCWQKSAHSE